MKELTFTFKTVQVHKRYPLTISRGTQAFSENLFVFASDGEHTGVGELSPATSSAWTAERGEAQLRAFLASGLGLDFSPHENYSLMRGAGIDPPAMAALDVALWDLLAKQAGMPLWRLLGLSAAPIPATSITAGLNSPGVTAERVPEMLERTGAKFLKIKLGSSEGIEFDKAHFLGAKQAAVGFGVGLRVDANGGWSPADAIHMCQWLETHHVDYVEQPLAKGSETELGAVQFNSPLPIFLDESICFAEDVVRFAPITDGINLKLMKCGGISEAMRILAAARACNLKTMIGCMSETGVAIGAGASLGSLLDFIDLDSHLNLMPDPAAGIRLEDGVVLPGTGNGHGVSLEA